MLCQRVFLDLGANIGVNSRFLYEAHKYPQNTEGGGFKMTHKMDEVFGKHRTDVCYVGFEANPNHNDRLTLLAKHFRNRPFTLLNRAVSIHNTNLTFYNIETSAEKQHKEWGFSEIKRHSQSRAVQVQALDFPRWFQTNLRDAQTIMMKIDIEGSEYELLFSMLAQGLLCKVHTITMEWHPHCKGVWCGVKNSLPALLRRLPDVDCNVTLVYADDESYLTDKVPL